jgi:hypothetical protein
MKRLTYWNNKEAGSALPVTVNDTGDTVGLETLCAKLAYYEDADERGRIIMLPENPTNFDRWRMGLSIDDTKHHMQYATVFSCQHCPAVTCPRKRAASYTFPNNEPPKCWDCFIEWATMPGGTET